MTTTRRLVASIVIAAALVWGDTTPVDAQTADDLFNDQVLHDVRLFVHSRDLEVLRDAVPREHLCARRPRLARYPRPQRRHPLERRREPESEQARVCASTSTAMRGASVFSA